MRGRQGFTLLELLVALVLTWVLFRGVQAFFLSQFGGYLQHQRRMEAQQQARIGIDLFTREVRMAYRILEAGTGADRLHPDGLPVLRFLADRNGNGHFDGSGDVDEVLGYQLSLSEDSPPALFQRRSGSKGWAQPLVPNVHSVKMAFFLDDGTVRPGPDFPAPHVLDPSERERVQAVRLTMEVGGPGVDHPDLRSSRTSIQTFSSTVWLRNR